MFKFVLLLALAAVAAAFPGGYYSAPIIARSHAIAPVIGTHYSAYSAPLVKSIAPVPIKSYGYSPIVPAYGHGVYGAHKVYSHY